ARSGAPSRSGSACAARPPAPRPLRHTGDSSRSPPEGLVPVFDRTKVRLPTDTLSTAAPGSRSPTGSDRSFGSGQRGPAPPGQVAAQLAPGDRRVGVGLVRPGEVGGVQRDLGQLPPQPKEFELLRGHRPTGASDVLGHLALP